MCKYKLFKKSFIRWCLLYDSFSLISLVIILSLPLRFESVICIVLILLTSVAHTNKISFVVMSICTSTSLSVKSSFLFIFLASALNWLYLVSFILSYHFIVFRHSPLSPLDIHHARAKTSPSCLSGNSTSGVVRRGEQEATVHPKFMAVGKL